MSRQTITCENMYVNCAKVFLNNQSLSLSAGIVDRVLTQSPTIQARLRTNSKNHLYQYNIVVSILSPLQSSSSSGYAPSQIQVASLQSLLVTSLQYFSPPSSLLYLAYYTILAGTIYYSTVLKWANYNMKIIE